MNIIGLDALIFGVDDIQACTDCLRDYGLAPVGVDSDGGRFEALDGTAVIIRRADDPDLPAAIGPAPSIRETVYGVAASSDLDAIEDELARDRQVTPRSPRRAAQCRRHGFCHCFSGQRAPAVQRTG